MSFENIARVGAALTRLLRDGSNLRDENVRLISMSDLGGSADLVIGLALYGVAPTTYARNEPRVADPSARPPRVHLDLRYLLAAFAPGNNEGDAQVRLGEAIGILDSRRILSGDALGQVVLDDAEQLAMTIEPLTLEDMARVWSLAPEASYRPSVSILVRRVPCADL